MELRSELTRILPPERVLTRDIDRLAFANDASVYRLVPAAVVLPTTVDEVRALFRLSRALRVPLTFRAAGTSLSGQAVTDGIVKHLLVTSEQIAEGPNVWVEMSDGDYVGVDFGMNLKRGRLLY